MQKLGTFIIEMNTKTKIRTELRILSFEISPKNGVPCTSYAIYAKRMLFLALLETHIFRISQFKVHFLTRRQGLGFRISKFTFQHFLKHIFRISRFELHFLHFSRVQGLESQSAFFSTSQRIILEFRVLKKVAKYEV